MEVYNLKIDNSKSALLIEELKTKKQISIDSIGWGSGDKEELVKQFKHIISNITNIRFNSLRIINRFKADDILVLSDLPRKGRFILAVVECDFNESVSFIDDSSYTIFHQIKLKDIFGIDSELDMHHPLVHSWYSKLSLIAPPVYSLSEDKDIFINLLYSLKSGSHEISENLNLCGFLSETNDEIKSAVKSRLNGLPMENNTGACFKDICRKVIQSFGYTLKGAIKYERFTDRNLLFDLPDDLSTPFGKSYSFLFVALKNDSGSSDKEDILSITNVRNGETGFNFAKALPCFIKSGEFDEETKLLAEANDIHLIDGDTLANLVIRKLL